MLTGLSGEGEHLALAQVGRAGLAAQSITGGHHGEVRAACAGVFVAFVGEIISPEPSTQVSLVHVPTGGARRCRGLADEAVPVRECYVLRGGR